MKKRMTELDIQIGIQKINEVYSQIPETNGCLEYINKPKESGGCEGRCCLYQNPSVLYIEFMNTWKYIMKKYDIEDILMIIESAVRTYLSDLPTKGCILFDKEKKICTQHEARPYNCRLYSQVPDEEFKPRYEALKVLQQRDFRVIAMPQCGLTKTVGERPTIDQSNEWWNRMMEIESECGIPKDQITDDQMGTYRTYHDHIVLHIFPDDILESLTKIKLSGNIHDKEICVLNTMSWFKRSVIESTEKVKKDRENNKEKIDMANKQRRILEQELKNLKS